MITAAIDNDILFKGVCYGLLEQLIAIVPTEPRHTGALGSARFVILAKMAKLSPPAPQLSQKLAEFLKQITVLEPTEEEATGGHLMPLQSAYTRPTVSQTMWIHVDLCGRKVRKFAK
jgi:hypothetical protein